MRQLERLFEAIRHRHRSAHTPGDPADVSQRPIGISRLSTASSPQTAPARGRTAGSRPTGPPPAPPVRYTPAIACDPATEMPVLWRIAREHPDLRRWLVANPRADAAILEYVAQAGGPGVREAFDVLFDDGPDEPDGKPPL